VTRRNRDKHDRLGQAMDGIRRRLENTPLATVSTRLSATVADLQNGLRAGQVQQEEANRLADYLDSIAPILPKSFGDRFRFDAGIIAAIRDEWAGGTTLSSMIVPRHAREWGHQSLTLPTYRGEKVPVMDLLLLRGEDDLRDINLLDYPFLAHELGHNALFRQESIFSGDFEADLHRHCNMLIRQSLADRGTAKVGAQKVVKDVRQAWTPTATHYNWAHEIAVDVIAVWTCGPAYLVAVLDILEDANINPYQIGQSHPPYDVRAKALVHACDRLDWPVQVHCLEGMIDSWPHCKWRQGKDNRYAALAPIEVVRACADRALNACAVLGLPRMTSQGVDLVDKRLARGENVGLGAELLIAAWLMREKVDEAAYERWERDAILKNLSEITL